MKSLFIIHITIFDYGYVFTIKDVCEIAGLLNPFTDAGLVVMKVWVSWITSEGKLFHKLTDLP